MQSAVMEAVGAEETSDSLVAYVTRYAGQLQETKGEELSEEEDESDEESDCVN